MNSKIVLVGGFHDIIELCETELYEILGIIDNEKSGSYLGYRILGTDEEAKDLYKEYSEIPLFIVPDLPLKRKHLHKIYADVGFKFCNLISSKSMISKTSKIGSGVLIRKGGNISGGTIIGNFVHINTMANVTHDITIGDYTSIGPSAVILGYVKIGNECFVGANTVILPNITIGNNAIIGAGAVVTKNVPDGATVVGNPAREINK